MEQEDMPTWGRVRGIIFALMFLPMVVAVVVLAWFALTERDIGDAIMVIVCGSLLFLVESWFLHRPFGVEDGVLFFRESPFYTMHVPLDDIVEAGCRGGGDIPNPFVTCLGLTLKAKSRWEGEQRIRCRATEVTNWFDNADHVAELARWINLRCGGKELPSLPPPLPRGW